MVGKDERKTKLHIETVISFKSIQALHILFTIREPGFYSAFLNELEKQSKLLVKRSKTSLLSFVTGRISRVFQENKACQIFRKTNISYPLIRTRTQSTQITQAHKYEMKTPSSTILRSTRISLLTGS